MGRETTRGTSPIDCGLEAFQLSVAVGMTPEEALRTALGATEQAAHIAALASTRDILLETAEDIDEQEDCDLYDDGPASLIFAAIAIDEVLPPELRKEPNADGV